jgi:hypothetical protein
MPLIRSKAQGNIVPLGRMATPRPPFPPELFSASPRSQADLQAEPMPESYDDIRFFKCKECNEIVPGYDLDDHVCDEPL